MPAKRRTRKNIPGYIDDAGVFHPIRGGEGYSAAKAGETWIQRRAKAKRKGAKGKSRKNPWIKAKAVKVIRNKAGRAVKLRIKT